MDPADIIDTMEEIIRSYVREGRRDLAAKLLEIEPLVAQFVASGDTQQLEVIGFRMRTWARDHQIRAIKLNARAIETTVTSILRLLAGAIA